MGTRSGDIDPAIIFYLNRKTGLTRDEVETLLNKESGLMGICGVNDMRQIEAQAQEGDPLALLAIEVDPAKNDRKSKEAFEIQTAGSAVKVLVIPTDEEIEIAEQTVRCLRG